MDREILGHLLTWKDHPLRKPLILRGARQVGKSWVVTEFGKQFADCIVVNFDKDKRVCAIFQQNLQIENLVETLELYFAKKIVVGQTLLFFDEIQECQEAISSLRYFKEELPQLHVIAAGSLLDFAIEKIGVPVGRVQFMYLYPLSFEEFLVALGYEDLKQHIHSKQTSPVIHEKILGLLKTYMWLGGMPAVVDAWCKYKNIKLCRELQDEIIISYSQDFHKYARDKQIKYVSRVFESIPIQLGRKFKFSTVEQLMPASPLKEALFLLEKAGIAHICYHSAGQTQALKAEINDKRFKVYFLDVGLGQRMLGIDLSNWMLQPLRLKTIGAIAEQLVAQEFIAYAPNNNKAQLYYWHREAKSSNAEVDFLTIQNGKVIPVEVKSGTTGRLKSMQLFLQQHQNSPYGLKIAENLFAQYGNIIEIPLYGINTC